MKAFIVVAVVASLVGLGFYLVPSANVSQPIKALPKPAADPPKVTQTDPVEIFQKAFWKRPTAEDKILHAERREWSNSDGVRKWQWFIVVEPSCGLVKYLRDENAFSLTSSTKFPVLRDLPEWFSIAPAAVDFMKSPNDNLCLFFSKTKRLLHATGSGGGFHPGARAPDKPEVAAPAPTGRLPLTPPPKPRPGE